MRFLNALPILCGSLTRPIHAVRHIATAAAVLATFASCEKKEAPQAAPIPVTVMKVEASEVPVKKTWVGTLLGSVGADIRAQVTGYLLKQGYQNGTFVKTGDLLFQIDPRPFEAAVAQAQGTYQEAEAQRQRDYLNAKRSVELYEKQVISQEQFDDATQAYAASRAAAEAAKAAVDQAQLNLGFTSIKSPIDGIAGIATAQVGDLLSPSSDVLATVTTVDPIRVDFPIAEQEYLGYIKQFFDDPEKSPVAKAGGKGFPITITLSDGSVYPHEGYLAAVNNTVSVDTGTIMMEGFVPNPGSLLRAGQYALVSGIVRTIPNGLLVPQSAVIDLQGTKQLAIVGPDNKVEIRTVKLGSDVGQQVLVESGLQSGETIVVEGIQRMKSGVVVNPQPAATPTPAGTPPEAAPVSSPQPAPDSSAQTKGTSDPSQPEAHSN